MTRVGFQFVLVVVQVMNVVKALAVQVLSKEGRSTG